MAEARRVLLTVSGAIPDDLDALVESGDRPRPDYWVLGERLEADVVDVPHAIERRGMVGRWVHRIGGAGPLLAWHVFRERRRYDVVLTDGEQVGLPLALLMRLMGSGGLRHVMIVHVLSVPKKARLIRWARLSARIDRYLVYCTRQQEYICGRLGVAAERVILTSFMVDSTFFDVRPFSIERRPMICSAGLERRDYRTLMQAVDGLNVDVVIAAASPWSKWADSSDRAELPENVSIERFTLGELRDLYAACQFVVMPLMDVDFQAGITTILEAMSMSRAVVCTRTPGQTDTIIHGETGVYVPVGDPEALRATIQSLLDEPGRADRLGTAARDWVVNNADIEIYADRLRVVIDDLGVALPPPG